MIKQEGYTYWKKVVITNNVNNKGNHINKEKYITKKENN